MIAASCRAAYASSACRRASESGGPSGNWCEGVVKTSRQRRGSRSTTRPSSSTGTGTTRRAVRGEQVARERVAGVLDRDHVARLAGGPEPPGPAPAACRGWRPRPPGRPGPRGSRPGAGPPPRAGPDAPRGRRTSRARSRGAPGRRAVGARCRTGRAWGRGCRPGSRTSGWAPTRSPGAGAGPRTGAAAAWSGGRVGLGLAPTAATKVPAPTRVSRCPSATSRS